MKTTLLTMAMIAMMSTTASALDLVVASAPGGTYHKFTTVLAKSLQEQGIDAEVKVAGNCILGKKLWQDSEDAIMFQSEASQAVPECNVPVTTDSLVSNVFTAGWVIVSKDGTLGNKMGVVSYMKQTVDDLDVTLVPYKNTREIKAAFLAGEIDSGFVVQAIADGLDAHVILDTMSDNKGAFADWGNNSLTLNYYLMQKGNVDANTLKAVRNVAKFVAIADKKKMQPVLLDNMDAQLDYLMTNEQKWAK